MDLKIANRLALVSGSTKGIGHAIAVALAREGARVIINGRSQASVDAALAKLRELVPNAQAEGFAGDVSDAAQVDDLVKRFAHVDILVNNMGIFDPKPFEEIPDEEWLRFFNANVMSGVRLSRAYLPKMNYPVRVGEHTNLAFSLRLAWDYAGTALASRVELYERFYLSDSYRMTGLAYKIADKSFAESLVEQFLHD